MEECDVPNIWHTLLSHLTVTFTAFDIGSNFYDPPNIALEMITVLGMTTDEFTIPVHKRFS